MRYVALLSPGPLWIEGKPVTEQDQTVIGGHLANMRRGYDAGSVLFGGPFTSEHGGIVLLDAADETAVRVIMDADPAVTAGLMVYRLIGVRVAFDAFTGKAWSPPNSN